MKTIIDALHRIWKGIGWGIKIVFLCSLLTSPLLVNWKSFSGNRNGYNLLDWAFPFLFYALAIFIKLLVPTLLSGSILGFLINRNRSKENSAYFGDAVGLLAAFLSVVSFYGKNGGIIFPPTFTEISYLWNYRWLFLLLSAAYLLLFRRAGIMLYQQVTKDVQQELEVHSA